MNRPSEATRLIFRKIANVLWFFLPGIILMISLVSYALIPEPEPELETELETEPTFPAVEIVKHDFYVKDYYEYSDETESTCYLEMTFNQNVYKGIITATFYDSTGKVLETKKLPIEPEDYFDDYGTKMVNDYVQVKGNVASYKVTDISNIESAEPDIYDYEYDYYDYEYEYDYEGADIVSLMIVWSFLRLAYMVPIVLSALYFKCKRYTIGTHSIVVYAGRLNNYIKVDGIKKTNRNAILSSVNLKTTLDTGEKIEVRISSFTKNICFLSNGIPQEPDYN